MRVELALLADYAAVTAEGKLVVCGVFDTLQAPSLPFVHPQMFLAVRVGLGEDEPLKHEFVLRLIDPDGRALIPEVHAEVVFSTPAGTPRPGGLQLVLQMPPVQVESAGPHALDILVDGRHEERVAFSVLTRETQGA